MRMLRSFEGTLVIVTHDVELLHHFIDTIWHIDQGTVRVLTRSYDDYRHELAIQLSRVSARTLRFYDEIAFLKPAFYGDNQYRYYEKNSS